MTLRIFNTMDNQELHDAWLSMERNSSPFLFYDYILNIWKYVKYFSFYFPRIVCVVSTKREILMIVPLRWDAVKRRYKMLADLQGCSHTDALFSHSLSEDEKKRCVDFFFKNIGYECKFKRILSDSPLLRLSQEAAVNAKDSDCVKIDFQGGVDELIKGLSKSVRQNIRTAYNRMKRDEIEFELVIYDISNPIGADSWNRLMGVYLDRLFAKYKKSRLGPIYKYTHSLKYRYVKHDTKSLRHLPNSFHAVLMTNGDIMSFLSAFMSHGKNELMVPRLCINDKYSFYSPGYILLVETLHYLETNGACRVMDLCRGSEKYKMDMGGQIYYTASIDYKPINNRK